MTPKAVPRIFNLAPFALSLAAAILMILVLVAGSSPAALPHLYLLRASVPIHTYSLLPLLTDTQVDTSSLSVPAKLSNSKYLVDLSALTSADLTGPPQTPSTLGIAPLYRVYVFTCCSPTSCTAPVVGPSFDPAHDLRLEATNLGATGASLEDALRFYGVMSPLLGVMLILAFVFVLGAPSVALLGRRMRSAPWVALGGHCLAAVCLIVACVAGQVGMARLRDGMNDELGSVGVRAYGGGLLYPAWAALPLCLINAVLAFLSVRRSRRVEEQEKEQRRRSEEQESPAETPTPAKPITPTETYTHAETNTPARTGQRPPPHFLEACRPAQTPVRRPRIKNTLHEDLREGWLRDSVLASMDRHKSIGDTGDGTGNGGSGAEAFHAAYGKPVRMPHYEH